MQKALNLYDSTVGKKVVMAVSGFILLGFVLGHLTGNLRLFIGPESHNGYAAWLRTMPAVLWGTRIALLFSFVAHFVSAFQLWRRNRAARPSQYKMKKDLATYYAAKTMYYSGPIVLFYVLYHLAHLTLGQSFGLYEHNPHNPYNNVIFSFQVWWISVIYIIGNLALALHLFHGIWSAFQSIGANHNKYNALRRKLAVALSVFIAVGNLSFPIAVMAGIVKPTDQTFCFPELASEPGECDQPSED